ncbi:MAG: undecaprenyldiphospho-muramoylpentapeptide beta-N-acetylglucosaminyltransferase [Saprospiraceae bacterium]|nr:undecaprenyldiphospho-muramoylpentapeptide beta-N-acetylglucosaminyltransferase [Saprospiraceae bacterium]
MSKTQKPRKIIISGGGSGGHVFPALAIADAIRAKEPDTEILFVGAQGKIEMEKVPLAGYPIKGLWISGLHRKLTLRNLAFPFKLISSLAKSFGIVRSFKPDVVVGVGGFASGPVLQVASWLGIPTLIQEQNSFPGLTNRLLAKRVDKICIAYHQMERYFPKEKLVMTGNPVRKVFGEEKMDQAAALAHFGLELNKKTLFSFGGSLGAQSINEALAANADLMKKHPEVQLLWQAGKLYYDRFKESEMAQLPNVEIRPFIDRMDLAYAITDLVIARAGALTIAELSQVSQPAILIPSPNVAEDHQTMNAKALNEIAAAVLLPDPQAKEKVISLAIEVVQDQARLKELAQNIHQLATPEASSLIAEEVFKLLPNKDG